MAQYSDTISCNGGLLEFAVHYDQQTCDFACNGQYAVEILNGVGPFNYTVTGPSYSSALQADMNLCPGAYSVTVDDLGQAINCMHNFNVLTLTPNTYTTNAVMPSSYGACDGMLEILVSGGVPPYSYQWYDAGMNILPGETGYQLQNICAGTYNVIFSDNTPPCGTGTGGVGTGGSTVVTIVLYDPVQVIITNTWEAVCPGTCSAGIEYTVMGGTGNYIDPFAGMFPACDGDVGTITICDDQGNCGSAPYALTGWPYVDIFGTATDESCFGTCDGIIQFTDNWGTAMNYSIDGGVTWQPSATFNNQCPGNYDLWAEILDAGYGGTCIIDVMPDVTINSGGGNDVDGDGWSDCAGDCNDFNPTVNPGMIEIPCNGIDDNCNGLGDDNPDADGDGYTICAGDCDDSDPSEYPGVTWYPDADGDGYGDMNAAGFPCERNSPTDVQNNLDCDDADPQAYPGQTWYADCDGDGWASDVAYIGCTPPPSPCGDMLYPDGGWHAWPGGDCDDEDPSVNPGMVEIVCNGIDDDCNPGTSDVGVDTDSDGLCDANDPDDDNDGVLDAVDFDPLNPYSCQDADGDGCDDCALGVDGYGPAADYDPMNDGMDSDGDGTCDVLDPCPLDFPDDTDGDGVCDSNDQCPGYDDNTDTDSDGVPDGCDVCPLDTNDDSDGDGVCDSFDNCPGYDDNIDTDSDGIADGCDLCFGDDAAGDADGDGICDDIDPCPFDPLNDFDGDNFCASAGDCDDTNPMINPSMIEVECNGIDDDCNPSTLDDPTAPVVDTLNLTNISSACPITPTAPTATDNCDGTIVGVPDVNFPISATGTTTVTWTYTDTEGNITSQTQYVTITPLDVTTTTNLIMDNQYDISANATGVTYQWVENCGTTYEELTGQTSSSFNPAANGSYGVIISDGTCSDTSDCIVINDVSIAENWIAHISVYPNPNNGAFTFQLPAEYVQNVQVDLLDVQGRQIEQLTITGEKSTFDLKHLENGLYYLKVSDATHHTIKRLVKQ